LHDSVTQSLYSLSLLIKAWQRKFHTGRPVPIDDYLAQFAEVTQQSLKEMRLLVYELRPPVLEKDGLIGALRQRLEAVEKRTGVEARLVAEVLVDLPDTLEEELYWIAREALNNTLKHANASEVEIHFSVIDGKACLEICDNGQGFDYEESIQSGGMGLRNMAERADRIGGQLEVHSDPGQGTTIKIKAPMNESTSGKIVSFNPSGSQEMNE
jgi:signal transduction histidine kinase